ncbi:MAG: YigZ family protein [Oscillospiraceae bacterium]|nr:YigZ family protein [Oscillospiraceae bacterium]
MAELIRVPYGFGESEFTEKRSRFIGHVWPVESEEEAQQHIRQTRAKYYDARHNCWCYRIGQGVVRYGDDGEPQGTAGQPMLKVLEREHVTNACCVVTRYFGGVLLGAGGLTRAYAKGAKDALSAAGAATLGLWARVRIPCPYPLLEQVKLELAAAGGTVDGAEYGADVALTASVPAQGVEGLQRRLTELSAGGVTVQELAREYRPGPREEL